MSELLRFRIKSPKGTSTLEKIDKKITLLLLKQQIHQLTDIPPNQQILRIGFPPALVEADEMDTATSVGLRSGTTIIVSCQEKETAPAVAPRPIQAPKMVRRIIEADNSCLFNAIGLVKEKGKGRAGNGDMFRTIIQQTIASDPVRYNAVFLGRPIDEYIAWILQPSSWGGEIELSILAYYFKVEIVALDIMTLNKYCYGTGEGFKERIFVVYDGIHYDAISETTDDMLPIEFDITRFDPNDEAKVEKAMELVLREQQKHAYTNVHNFALRCLECQQGLRGQKEAQEHASRTGHRKFGEMK